MSEAATFQEANEILLRATETARSMLNTLPTPFPAWAGSYADGPVQHGEVTCTALSYTYGDEIFLNRQGVSGYNRLDIAFHRPDPNCLQPDLLRVIHDSELAIPRSHQLGRSQLYRDYTRLAVYSMAGHATIGADIDTIATTVWEAKWRSWEELRVDVDTKDHMTNVTAEDVSIYSERALRFIKGCLRPWFEVWLAPAPDP